MEFEYSKHMLRTQSSELSLSRTKHEFPFEFRKRIKFPFLSHFEKGNYALKKECFSISQKQSYHTHTHTQNSWVYYYTIFLCGFFGLNWSHNFDCVFGYAKRLSSSQQLCFFFFNIFLLLLPFNNLFHIYNKPFCSLSTPLPIEFMVLSPRPWG